MIYNNGFRLLLIIMAIFFFNCAANGQQENITNDNGYEIFTSGYGFETKYINFYPESLNKKNNWKGRYIWLNSKRFPQYQQTQIEWVKNPGYTKQYKALFRKTFDLDTIPTQAILSITADVSFRMYINGVFVAQGPPDAGIDYFDGVPPTHWFFTSHDVAGDLVAGKNTLAVEVFSHFREISETSSGQGLLLCDIDKGNGENLVCTDTTWKGMADFSFSAHGGNYTHEANAEPVDWTDVTFNDSDWEYASLKNGKMNGYLLQSKIPVPIRSTIQPAGLWLPESTEQVSNFDSLIFKRVLYNDEFTLDFNRNLTAYYGFTIQAHKNDTVKIFPYEKKIQISEPQFNLCM